jgi:hypothetical protein
MVKRLIAVLVFFALSTPALARADGGGGGGGSRLEGRGDAASQSAPAPVVKTTTCTCVCRPEEVGTTDKADSPPSNIDLHPEDYQAG